MDIRRLLMECGYAFLDLLAGCFVVALILIFCVRLFARRARPTEFRS